MDYNRIYILDSDKLETSKKFRKRFQVTRKYLKDLKIGDQQKSESPLGKEKGEKKKQPIELVYTI